MTNGTKILIGILAIAVIGIGISTAMKTERSKEVANNQQNNVSDMLQYMEDSGKKENKQENVTKNNTILKNEIVNEIQNEVKNEVVGKEEEESKKENTELSNEQKAIKLAQEEWAISISSYDFQAELQSDSTYKVTVRSNDSNRTTVAIYTVDVKNETVTEI